MRPLIFSHALSFLVFNTFQKAPTTVRADDGPIGPNPNPKRGLSFVPDADFPKDNQIWIQADSPLTWYYNYQPLPSAALQGGPTELQFVPMLWGDYDNSFVDEVKGLISSGYNITHVLGFNEPDNAQDSGTGGSGIDPGVAASRWKESIEPLAQLGIKLGSPAPTGAPSGLEWMKEFFQACSDCTIDFIPLHWYGNFEGLASHLGEYAAAFPGKKFWFTEFAFDHQDVGPSQDFFNMTIEYFERLDYLERYSYFGAFRSSVSNVGPNSAMLNQNGGLTYLGAWYLNKDESVAASETGTDTAPGKSETSMLQISFLGISIAAITGIIGSYAF